MRPMEHELNKLERRADRTKKEYRKAVQRDILGVKAKIADMEEETTPEEVARSLESLASVSARLKPRHCRSCGILAAAASYERLSPTSRQTARR